MKAATHDASMSTYGSALGHSHHEINPIKVYIPNLWFSNIRNLLGNLRNDYNSDDEDACEDVSEREKDSADEEDTSSEECQRDKSSSDEDDTFIDGILHDIDSSKYNSPIETSGRRVTTRNTGGSSPLLTGETLGFVDGPSSIDHAFNEESSSTSSEEACSSDSENEQYQGAWKEVEGLPVNPKFAELKSVPMDIIPFANSYTFVPRRNTLRRKGIPLQHADLLNDVLELTEEQGTPDWFILRRFVSTSTTQMEINRAVSLLQIEDEGINNKFNAVKKVLRMRVSLPTPEDAPETLKNFLLALGDGGSIDVNAKDWWKQKYEGKIITGTNHINPALLHLGIKVCYPILHVVCLWFPCNV